MKIDAKIYGSHNPYGEYHWVSRLRENFTSGSEGEGLETGNLAPRQSFTRQYTLYWLGNFRRLIVRYDRLIEVYNAFLHLAFIMLVLKRL